MRNLKQTETEEQWKERLRIRREKEMAQEMDKERKTSLEKMLATELLKLAMETD